MLAQVSEAQEAISWAITEAGRALAVLTAVAAALSPWWGKRVKAWRERKRLERAAALAAVVADATRRMSEDLAEVKRLTGENHHSNPAKPTVPDRITDAVDLIAQESQIRAAADERLEARLDEVVAEVRGYHQTATRLLDVALLAQTNARKAD